MEYSLLSCFSQPENDPSTLTPTTPLVQTSPTTAQEQTSPESPTTIGAAVIQIRLVFNDCMIVPSECLVLSDMESLLKSTLTSVSESVTVLDYSYNEKSNTSFAVNIIFSINNISMPMNPDLRSDTYTQVKSIFTNIVNTVLNNSGASPSELTSYNFTSLGDQVTGYMEYSLLSCFSQPENDTSPTLTPTTPLVQTSPESQSTIDDSILLHPSTRQKQIFPTAPTSLTSPTTIYESVDNPTTPQEQTSPESTTSPDLATSPEPTNSQESTTSPEPTTSQETTTSPESPNQLDQSTTTPTTPLVQTSPTSPGSPTSPTTIDYSTVTSTTDQEQTSPASPTSPNHPTLLTSPTSPTLTSPTLTTSPTSPTTVYESTVIPTIIQEQTSPTSPTSPSSPTSPTSPTTMEQSTATPTTAQEQTSPTTAQEQTSPPTAQEQTSPTTIEHSTVTSTTDQEQTSPTSSTSPTTVYKSTVIPTIIQEQTSPTSATSPTSPTSPTAPTIIDKSPVPAPQAQTSPEPTTTIDESTLNPATPQGETSPGPSSSTAGSAVVYVRLMFSSSTPVPSENGVSAFKALLNSTLSKLPDTVTVQNFTHKDISDRSYEVILTFLIRNISVPESVDLTNNIYTQVKTITNDSVNTLLIPPGAHPIDPTSYNFTSSGDQVTGHMEYSLEIVYSQPGNDTSPTPSATTPLVQTSPGSPTTIIGSAVIQTKLVFNVSSPGTIENVLPRIIKSTIESKRQNVSEASILGYIQILLLSAFPNLAEPLGVLDYSYEKISDTFLVVNITFTIKNIIMPENPELRDGTYTQMKNIINNAINYLTEAQLVEPITYNFLSSGDQVNGYMEYSFEQIPSQTANDNKVLKQPSTESPTTTDGSTLNPTTRLEQTSPESPTIIDGSAVVNVRMVFHNSTSVSSEDVVLSDFKAMLNSTLSKFPNSVTVQNVTYEPISNTSFAVLVTFSISSISMPEDPALRNDTYTQVKVLINDTVNTVLNNSGTQRPVELTSYNFKSLGDQVTGYMEYSLQSLLSQPENDTSPTLTPTTTLVQTSPGSPTTIDGSAVVNVRMVFHNTISVPSGDVVLSDFKAMLNSTLSKFPNSVTVQNVTYEPISNTSFVVLVTFSISSISMPEDPALRNDTYTQVKVLINDTVNTVLNNSGTQRPVELTSYNFKSLGDQVTGYMEYSLQSFLSQPENDTSPTLTPTTTLVQTSPGSPTTIDGSAVVNVRMVFHNTISVPSGDVVLSDFKAMLNSTLSKFPNSVTVQNVTYEPISNTSFAVLVTFSISSISMPEDPALRNDTYTQVKVLINDTVNTVLNNSGTQRPVELTSYNFKSLGDQVTGYMEYSLQSFLSQPENDTSPTLTPTTTLVQTSPGSPTTIIGSAVIQTKLVFNVSSPGTIENVLPGMIKSMIKYPRQNVSEALSLMQILLLSAFPNLAEPLGVLDYSYEKISDTFLVVNITFTIKNIIMPENPELRDGTYTQMKNIINNAINYLTEAQLVEPITYNFL
ncbi:mucin-3A-like [Silurus meridionalis]|uniref:mucin-3A-like n=1 Tax=Silurus meridionalis TaxID=175797 RepID=UPI001EEB8D8E|nr:mucin-3A-like [Silurus meridionalis]